VGSDGYCGKAIDADHGVVVSVDVSSLELEVPRLESLRDFPNAVQAARLHNSYLTTVGQSYAHVAGQRNHRHQCNHLTGTARRRRATRLNVGDIDAILASTPPGGGAATSMPVDNAGPGRGWEL
jgi:hypothetical protein